MASNYRTERVGNEIQKELSRLISNLKDPRIPPMIAVTAVKVTNDLSYAKVYVNSIAAVNGEVDMKSALKGLQSSSGYLRHELMKLMVIRKVPELRFEVDATLDEGIKIYEMLKEMGIQKSSEEGSDE